jgi:hypothetical protein
MVREFSRQYQTKPRLPKAPSYSLHLPPGSSNRGQHFDEVQRAIVIDVLNGIVQQQALPSAPWLGQVHRQ